MWGQEDSTRYFKPSIAISVVLFGIWGGLYSIIQLHPLLCLTPLLTMQCEVKVLDSIF